MDLSCALIKMPPVAVGGHRPTRLADPEEDSPPSSTPSLHSRGNPWKSARPPAQQHEATIAEDLLDFVHGTHCIADGGYDADRILKAIKDRELKAVIRPSMSRKRRRRYDRHLYRLRYRVEVFFHSLKRYRRIATRYDKTIACFMGFVHVVCTVLCM